MHTQFSNFIFNVQLINGFFNYRNEVYISLRNSSIWPKGIEFFPNSTRNIFVQLSYDQEMIYNFMFDNKSILVQSWSNLISIWKLRCFKYLLKWKIHVNFIINPWRWFPFSECIRYTLLHTGRKTKNEKGKHLLWNYFWFFDKRQTRVLKKICYAE